MTFRVVTPQPAPPQATTPAGGAGRPATGAAFFDLDGTLLRGAVLYHFARGMVARGRLRWRDVARHGLSHVGFRLAGENPATIAAVRDRSLALGAGWVVDDLAAISLEIYDELVAPRLWQGTVELARGHLAAGEAVYIVTAAPVEIARIAAQRLGLTGALGTVAEVADGAWTGRLVGDLLHGPAKAVAVGRFIGQAGLDPARCAGYSDSWHDLPLLELVGRPHAVNPDRRLRRVAAERGWPVHDFDTRRSAARHARYAGPAAMAGAGVAGAGVGAWLLARHPGLLARRPGLRVRSAARS